MGWAFMLYLCIVGIIGNILILHHYFGEKDIIKSGKMKLRSMFITRYTYKPHHHTVLHLFWLGVQPFIWMYYKERKCTGNKKSSVCIEICRDKTFIKCTSRIVTGHSRNNIQDVGILVWDHLAKIKVDFFEIKRLVFIIVINTSCSCIVAQLAKNKVDLFETKMPAFIVINTRHLLQDLCPPKIPLKALCHYFRVFGGHISGNKCLQIRSLFLH